MSVVGHQEILSLQIRGQRFDLMIPEFARGFKRLHLSQPGVEYEPVLSALLEQMINATERPQILDIGAYIGYYSVLAGLLVGGRGHVWAIESNLTNVEVIRQETALNHLGNVEVVHTALSDRSELMRTLTDRVVPLPADASDESDIVRSESCDDLCERLGVRPNIVKMDVHGCEGRILRGMKKVLRDSVDCLLLELHPKSYLDKFTPVVSRLEIIEWLNEAGLRTYYVPGITHPFPETYGPGQFAYWPLTNETRRMLLFDDHIHVLVAATRQPVENLIGPSTAGV